MDIHPAQEAALRAVDGLLRSRIDINGDVARRSIRCEITPEVAREFLRREERHYHRDGRPDPLQFAGISFYTVRELPEPGWRIINPFEEDR